MWVLGSGYARQGLRLASNLVLTRLLFPEAFGLMALVSSLQQLLHLFSEIGVGSSVIHHPEGREPLFLNTAWTIQILRGLILLILGWLIAGALYALQSMDFISAQSSYANVALPALFAVASLNAAVTGFTSISIFVLNRQLKLRQLVLFEIGIQLIKICFAVLLAYLFRSVWALIAGGLIASVARVAISHALFRGHRHQLALDRTAAAAILKFGKWILIGTIAGFLARRGSRLVFGFFVSEAVLGLVGIAILISSSLSRVIGRLEQRVLFPAYAQIAALGRLHVRKQVVKVRWAMIAIRIPFTLLVALFGSEIISLLYDDRYGEAGPMLRLLAAGLAVSPLPPYGSILLGCGDSFRCALVDIAAMIFNIACIATGAVVAGTTGMLIGYAATSFFLYPVAAWALHKHGGWVPKLDLLQFGVGLLIVLAAWWYAPLLPSNL